MDDRSPLSDTMNGSSTGLAALWLWNDNKFGFRFSDGQIVPVVKCSDVLCRKHMIFILHITFNLCFVCMYLFYHVDNFNFAEYLNQCPSVELHIFIFLTSSYYQDSYR